MNAIGMHYVDGVFTEAQIAEHLDWLGKAQPGWITVQGGGQLDQALDFAKTVQADQTRLAGVNVIFRHWRDDGPQGDNGRHARHTVGAIHETFIEPYAGTGLTSLWDNEGFSGGYGQKAAEAIEIAARDDCRLAVGAFSTHNPPEAEWETLIPMFLALDRYGGVFTPHAYWSDHPSVTNWDGIDHVLRLIAFARRFITNPDVAFVIGELGRCQNRSGTRLDPDKGYLADGIGEDIYASEIIRFTRERFLPAGVYVDVFSIGNWKQTFGVTKTTLKAIESEAAAGRLKIEAQSRKDAEEEPPVVVRPPRQNTGASPVETIVANPGVEDPRWLPATIYPAGGTANVRSSPRLGENVVARLTVGPKKAHVIGLNAMTKPENAAAIQDGHIWTLVKLVNNTVGWMRDDAAKIELIPPPQPEPPSDSSGGSEAKIEHVKVILAAMAEIDRQNAIISDAVAAILNL